MRIHLTKEQLDLALHIESKLPASKNEWNKHLSIRWREVLIGMLHCGCLEDSKGDLILSKDAKDYLDHYFE